MKSVFSSRKGVATFRKADRLLLAIYLIALLGLLMFPIEGPEFRFLGIGTDKWMHVALFGGLAMMLRWNLSANRHAVFVAVGVAFVVAAATELAQGLVAYRSAEFMDLVAGLLGALFGATAMNRVVSSPVLEKWIGLLVAILGLMIGVFFLLAGVNGVGETDRFGTTQMAGMACGAIIAARGVGVYLKGIRGESRCS